MPRCLLLLLFLLGGFTARAQQEFTIDDFSSDYVARIHVDTLFRGWVGVYDQKTKRQLVRVASADLSEGLDGNLLGSSGARLPYAEQHVLISGDFNFDGRPDLAIQEGRNSCHLNPSFKVYLATPAGFAHSEEFSYLAQAYCGMFGVDAERQRLSVQQMGHWGQESVEFSVRDNKPFRISSSREDQSQYPFVRYSQEEWNGSRLVSRAWRELELGPGEAICAFPLVESGKRVVLFVLDSRVLCYALLRRDDSVEFNYPTLLAEEAPPFTLHQTGSGLSLRFQNGAARYEIRETPAGQLTVTARFGAKTRQLTGAATRKTGSLRPLLTMQLDNLTLPPPQ
ncbi:hypothetical protein EJV47_24930 [Hymenobacter gummosus]|uniref:VCBS repeat-containing protein n=1 Tax=Hymenobacter gummosus TaxID=1776032 RepID=A0A3S0J5X4_9BACT|nr:hypothetical protein [Hymenobacter gummosus]RTQ45388.1 hypothetical protein EJV47_24930 [Hymenobacter gummosus]